MATASKAPPSQMIRATVTSKGQVTIPVEVRKALGVKAGDKLRFELHENGFRVVREIEENVFEKWRGIGDFPGMGKGRDALIKYFRELRGHDDLD
jgi:AbrB family looped-hinge helix DNA binding protein